MKEMSDQTRGVLFVVLAAAIFFIWQHYYLPAHLPPPQKPAASAQTTTQPTAPQTATPATKPGGPSAASGVPVIRANEEKTVVVESPLYSVELSNRGGVVKSWKLKKYFDDQKPPRELDLVNADVAKELGWPFSIFLTDPQQEAQANSALYQITPTTGHLAAPGTITFHWSDGHLEVTKKLTFNESYEMSIETAVAFDGKPVPGSGVAWRGGFGDKAVYKASSLVTVFYKLNEKLELLPLKKLGVPDNQIQPALQAGPLAYTGMEDQFFTVAFLPDSPDLPLSLWHWTQFHHFTSGDKPESEQMAEIAAGSPMPQPLQLRVFVGPKDLTLLSREKPPLDELVQFGWWGFIAKPLFETLKWVHRYIPNYGWAIVVLTLVINIAMFPLKMKSWRSMQQMQKIGPEMRAINDRYKKYSMTDPRQKKKQEELMELYQRHGISPMTQLGGCLPMMLQMPIWIALWRVLNGAIELRHAPWIGWIHDLSAMDPYYILPVTMTIAMFVMTKMTPTPAGADPAQQKMMALMPLMMLFFFYKMSSGLNLYMFTSNLVGVGQQWYLNRTKPLPTNSKFKKKKTE